MGVKTEGGFVDFMTREVEIECLPRDIPENIKVDISGLHLHQSLKIADVAAPAGVKFVTDPAAVIAVISMPHKEEEVVKPVEEVAAAAEPAEPEVIKKERAEKEEEEAEREKGEREGVIVVGRRGPGKSRPRIRRDEAQRRLPVCQAAGPAVGR